MSLLRSTERLLEGSIGDISVTPLISYPITIYELGLLNGVNIVNSLIPNIPHINLQGKVDVYGVGETNSIGSTLFSDFIKSEVMRFWGLPKKLSIKLYEQEYEDIYVIRPRVIDKYLVVDTIAPIHIDYCQDSYTLGLGEDREVIGTKYWKCSYIDSIKVYERFGVIGNWIQWTSF